MISVLSLAVSPCLQECIFEILLHLSVVESSLLEMTVTDKISLEVETQVKFSVWVSFCEIYNENIHDLLELLPTGASRRTALRLSQDVKGNAFVRGVMGGVDEKALSCLLCYFL